MRSLTGVVVALAILSAPAAAGAQAQLPVGESHGVRVVRPHKTLVVILSAKLHKRFAGKELIVSCTTLVSDGANSGSQQLRVPQRGRRLDTGDLTRKIDFCRVARPRHGKRPKQILVSVPLTQKGAVFLDEEAQTLKMVGVLVVASLGSPGESPSSAPTYDELARALPERLRAQFERRVVPLAAAGDTPPAGKVGYYGDGSEHVAVVTVSRSGRRLFIEFGPDDVFSTNVLSHIFNERE